MCCWKVCNTLCSVQCVVCNTVCNQIIRLQIDDEIALKIHLLVLLQVLTTQPTLLQLFELVPEYEGLFRPKHHFLAHLARDVWRFGPPRGYWCFGFESFNRVIKAGAQHSNWKRSSLSIMQYWSMQSARGLVKRRRSEWCDVAPALECLC